MHVFIVGTKLPEGVESAASVGNDTSRKFLHLGTFDTKESAKAFIEANAGHVMGDGAAPLTLYKVALDEAKVYSFTRKDLEGAYRQQQSQQAARLAKTAEAHAGDVKLSKDVNEDDVTEFEGELLEAFNYTKEQRARAVKQMENQVKSFQTAINQLSGHPDLQKSLQTQLDALNDALKTLKSG